ncbi:MAG: zinc ribbon domain-containing protein [Candidatus Hermodarchaeota archaeon]
MGDENAASTFVLVAAILQLIISLYNLVSGVFSALTIPLFMFDPLMMLLFGWLIFFSIILSIVLGVVGIIFSILWFNWRHSPGEHKTGLIVSGVLGIFLGVIPGILVLIGGAIAPSPTEYIGFEPVKTMPYRTEKRCSSCGAEATADDKFCWRCGALL